KVTADRLGGLRVFPSTGRIAADIAQWQQRPQLHNSAPLVALREATPSRPPPPSGRKHPLSIPEAYGSLSAYSRRGGDRARRGAHGRRHRAPARSRPPLSKSTGSKS